MTLTPLGNGQYTALSTDTRPTGIAVGTLIYETDTRITWIYQGSSIWVPVRSVISPILSGRKYGYMMSYGGSLRLDGFGATMTASTTAATATNQSSSTRGWYSQFPSGVSGTSVAGSRMSSFLLRTANPLYRFRGAFNQTANVRGYIGFVANSADISGDSWMDSKSGIVFGFRSTDTTFQIIRNDGSATATYVDTTIPLDTVVRTIEILADDVNTRWGWRINGGVTTWYTTAVPAAATSVGIVQEAQQTTTTAVSLDILGIELEYDTK